MKSQKFGIEIEMTGLTRERAAEVISEYLNSTYVHCGGSYDEYHVTDQLGRTWKLMRDASIICHKKRGGKITRIYDNDYSVELVSPILTYSDIPVLQEIVRQLRHAGAISSSKYMCGIHIHVDASPYTPQTLRNLVNLMASKENLIYKSLQIDSSRECNYCKKVNNEMLEIINKKKPQTMSEFSDIWYGTNPDRRDRSAHYHSSRYHSLNLHSTFTKGTVEFRLFNGTTHAGEIRSYIVFCLAVSHQALVQSRVSAKRTTTDNEKYTFRCWLLRLGLIGDEFKNCREHLMKHLSGDAAWRDANRRRPAA